MSFFRRVKQQTKKTAQNVFLIFTGVVLGVIMLGGASLYYLREPLIKWIVLDRISRVTGFRVRAQTLRHEFPLRLTLSGVKMYNYKGYQPKVFATASYFYFELDLPALLKGKVFYIREWDIAMNSLNLDRSKDGMVNGMLLKGIKNFMNGRSPEQKGGGVNAPPSPMDFRMDRLTLRIDKISYRDRTGLVPRKSLKKLKLRAHAYENTTDFGHLIDIIEEDVLKEMQLTQRVELSPFYLERSIKKTADTVKGTAGKFAEGAGKVVKTTTVTAVSAPGEILKTAGGMVGIRKEIIKTERVIEKADPRIPDQKVLDNPPTSPSPETSVPESDSSPTS